MLRRGTRAQRQSAALALAIETGIIRTLRQHIGCVICPECDRRACGARVTLPAVIVTCECRAGHEWLVKDGKLVPGTFTWKG